MKDWFKSQNANEVTYIAGLTCLFIGLTNRVSIETALIVVGAVMTLESVVTSYLATWLSLRDQSGVRK